MNLPHVRKLLTDGEVELELSLPHAVIEAKKDGLTTDDLSDAVMLGEVVEDYGERVLLLHFATSYQIPFHIVLEYLPGDPMATVVTAYVPGSDRWEAGWKTRRRDRRKKQRKRKR